jgi:hypothetical protein
LKVWSPVITLKIEDCHHEFGKPEPLAWSKEAPEAVFQTSTRIHAVPPGGTVLMYCSPPSPHISWLNQIDWSVLKKRPGTAGFWNLLVALAQGAITWLWERRFLAIFGDSFSSELGTRCKLAVFVGTVLSPC